MLHSVFRIPPILAALDTLNDRERHIVELCYFADLPNTEIAELLQLTPSNVGVILHRALEKLKQKRFIE